MDAPTPPPNPAEPPRLAQAPGERYRAPERRATPDGRAAATGATERAPGPASAIVRAAVVADIGGLAFFVLGNIDLGAGLLAVAAAGGWATAVAMRSAPGWNAGILASPTVRAEVAAALALAAIVIALGALAVFANLEGGTLSPIDYLATRFGPLAGAFPLAAAVTAAARAR